MDGDLKCKKCDSSQTRARIKTKTRVCYTCGDVWEIEKKKLKEDEVVKK